jgi:hypothetical protein
MRLRSVRQHVFLIGVKDRLVLRHKRTVLAVAGDILVVGPRCQ